MQRPTHKAIPRAMGALKHDGNVIHADFRQPLELMRQSWEILYANEDVMLIRMLTEINGETSVLYQTIIYSQQSGSPAA